MSGLTEIFFYNSSNTSRRTLVGQVMKFLVTLGCLNGNKPCCVREAWLHVERKPGNFSRSAMCLKKRCESKREMTEGKRDRRYSTRRGGGQGCRPNFLRCFVLLFSMIRISHCPSCTHVTTASQPVVVKRLCY